MTTPNGTFAEEGDVVGSYVVYAPFASGGMASVHFGRLRGAQGFSRVVAIKRLRADLAGDAKSRAMLVDEARATARIRHPNVVPTLDMVLSRDEIFLVMDYVHGESFARLLAAQEARCQRAPVGVVLAIVQGA